jgi:hypothetical protein
VLRGRPRGGAGRAGPAPTVSGQPPARCWSCRHTRASRTASLKMCRTSISSQPRRVSGRLCSSHSLLAGSSLVPAAPRESTRVAGTQDGVSSVRRQSGKKDTAALLLSLKSAVDAANMSGGCWACHYACVAGSVDTALSLVDHGADKLCQTYLGHSPFQLGKSSINLVLLTLNRRH